MTRDAGSPPTWPVAGSGDHATRSWPVLGDRHGPYRRERTGKGSYVTTSLLAEGVWAAGVSIAGALAEATFYPLHDRQNPPNATLNPLSRRLMAAGSCWLSHRTNCSALATGHWPAGFADRSALQRSRKAGGERCRSSLPSWMMFRPAADGSIGAKSSTRRTSRLARFSTPPEVVNDPQLRANDIVVPLEGAGGKLTLDHQQSHASAWRCQGASAPRARSGRTQ